MKKLFILGLVISFVFCSCSNQQEKLYRIQENGLYGFIDSLGNVVIAPQYKYVSPFTKSGFALVISSIENIDENQIKIKYGVIDSSNKIVIDTTLQATLSCDDPVMAYSKQVTDSIVVLYRNNNLSFNSALFSALIPSSKLVAIQNPTNKLWGYISLEGDTIVPCKYKSVRGYRHDLSVVVEPYSYDPQKDALENFRTWSIIDTKGQKLTRSSYNMIMDYSKDNTWAITAGLGNQSINTEYSLLDTSGKTILGPFPVYQGFKLYNGNDDRFIVEQNFLGIINYNFIDSKGNFLIGENSSTSILDEFLSVGIGDWATDVTSFSDSICGMKVKYQDKIGWMFLDRDFNLASYEVYDSVGCFSEGLAAVKEYSGNLNDTSNDLPKGSRKWGFVNHEFNQVIPYRYTEVGAFYNALCYFKLVGTVTATEGYINKKGEIIWEHDINLH